MDQNVTPEAPRARGNHSARSRDQFGLLNRPDPTSFGADTHYCNIRALPSSWYLRGRQWTLAMPTNSPLAHVIKRERGFHCNKPLPRPSPSILGNAVKNQDCDWMRELPRPFYQLPCPFEVP